MHCYELFVASGTVSRQNYTSLLKYVSPGIKVTVILHKVQTGRSALAFEPLDGQPTEDCSMMPHLQLPFQQQSDSVYYLILPGVQLAQSCYVASPHYIMQALGCVTLTACFMVAFIQNIYSHYYIYYRTTAATHVHDRSSRSHAIFTISFTQVFCLSFIINLYCVRGRISWRTEA